MNKTKYLVLGNSVAGIACAEGIREADPDGHILIAAKEPHHTYSRPLITYLLGGKVDEANMDYRPPEFYDKMDVETALGTEITQINPADHTVDTADGEQIGYEKLLIAIGGEPIVPPNIEGSDADGVFTFTTLDDAYEIEEYIEDNDVEAAVIVGGGLIGLKSVEALMELGLRTTVVELMDRMLSATFDRTASDMAQRKLESEGADVCCETTVSRIITEDGKVAGAELTDGSTIDCGLVIFAIGVAPSVHVVEGTDIEVDRGILVDDRMQTTAEDVYAAGDIAQACELLSGDRQCIAIFPNAYRQGKIAGLNMAGADRSYDGALVMNSVSVCDLPTISVGRTEAGGEGVEELIDCDEDSLHYRKIVLEHGKIIGAVFVGDIERAGIFTGLIREQIDVTKFKDLLLSDEFGIIHLPDDYRTNVMSGVETEA
ncbi:MAG: NAD(P)/FAD-dependent oxidoreductase [Armatimonadota bacterium]